MQIRNNLLTLHSLWCDGRVVRHRSAKPATAVRFRFAPPLNAGHKPAFCVGANTSYSSLKGFAPSNSPGTCGAFVASLLNYAEHAREHQLPSHHLIRHLAARKPPSQSRLKSTHPFLDALCGTWMHSRVFGIPFRHSGLVPGISCQAVHCLPPRRPLPRP